MSRCAEIQARVFEVHEPLVHGMLCRNFVWISMPVNRKFPVTYSGNPECQLSVIRVYTCPEMYSDVSVQDVAFYFR